MAIPRVTQTIRNDGLGLVNVTSDAFLFIGPSSDGTEDTMTRIASPAAGVDTFGQGPLVEHVATFTSLAGPCFAVRAGATTAGAAGTPAKTAADSSSGTIAVTGTPYDAYDVVVEIVTTGDLGDAEFRYSLDGGANYSGTILTPAGGTYAVPNTGINLNFTAGAGPIEFEDGDVTRFTCTGPYMASADVADAIAAARDSGQSFDVVVVCGVTDTAATAGTLFSALSTQLNTLATSSFRYVAGMIDAASDEAVADVRTAFQPLASDRVLAAYGKSRLTSAKPITGWGQPMYDGLGVIAARAALLGLSGDLKRVASGAIPGFTSADLTHDERTATTSLDDIGITTFRTWQGRAGAYITQGRIKSGDGSDFRLFPARRVMDRAARVTYDVQSTFIGRRPRVNSDATIAVGLPGAPGTIDARDAAAYEREVLRQLRAALTQPANADGGIGHVSALSYTIDPAYDVLANKAIQSTTRLVPLSTIDQVQNELSFSTTV